MYATTIKTATKYGIAKIQNLAVPHDMDPDINPAAYVVTIDRPWGGETVQMYGRPDWAYVDAYVNGQAVDTFPTPKDDGKLFGYLLVDILETHMDRIVQTYDELHA